MCRVGWCKQKKIRAYGHIRCCAYRNPTYGLGVWVKPVYVYFKVKGSHTLKQALASQNEHSQLDMR